MREAYAGQGNHNLRVGDVDGDGCDEIMYGSCAIDHDGKGLYSTPVSYTHLDVYKRQLLERHIFPAETLLIIISVMK